MSSSPAPSDRDEGVAASPQRLRWFTEAVVIEKALRSELEPAGYHVEVNADKTLIRISDVLKRNRPMIEVTLRQRPVLR